MKFLILALSLVLSAQSVFAQDLSRYGDAVITDTTTEEILDHAESVAFDQQREEWVVKVKSFKNDDVLLTTRYPRNCRVFVEEGELIPMPVKGKRIVKLFQLYTDRKDIPLEYYLQVRDKAYQVSLQK